MNWVLKTQETKQIFESPIDDKHKQTMRKNVAEGSRQTVPLSLSLLLALEKKGYQYVQVKAFTSDKHFDYVDPRVFIMVPLKELPIDPILKDIYEPINSELLKKWAVEEDEMTEFRIAMN